MKRHLYHATAVAAGTIALSAALQNSALPDLIYDSALTGGAVWATATASVGNFGQSEAATKQ